MQLNAGQPRRLVNGPSVRTDYRLLECSEDLLATIISEGVVLKGGANDEAVLCTSSKTFAVKLVETTNLQMLVDPSAEVTGAQGMDIDNDGQCENTPPPLTPQFAMSMPGLQTQITKMSERSAATADVVVCATNGAHLELVECAPRLEQLYSLLMQRPYGLADEEEAAASRASQTAGESAPSPSVAGLYTLEQLLARVQASESELRTGLSSMGAVSLGRHWRLVEPAYLGTLLELVISSAQALGCPLSAIPARALCDSLEGDGYPPQLVSHCLSVYGAPAVEVCADGAGGMDVVVDADGEQQLGPGLWALDDTKVCVHFLGTLLSGGRITLLSELMAEWQTAVPEPFAPTVEMLSGEALVTGKGAIATAKRFSSGSLPADPRRRFDALFEERARWEAAEIEPYIAGVKVPGSSTTAVLLKYARMAQPTPNDPVSYTKR